MKQVRAFCLALGAVISFVPHGFGVDAVNRVPDACVMDPVSDPETYPAFRRLLKAEPNTSAYEKARIDYLTERVNKSPYQYIRNGTDYDGTRAAFHMRYKYAKYKAEAATAEAFVESIASRSRKTGRLYLIKLGPKTCELKQVLFKELDQLNKLLEDSSKGETQLRHEETD